MANEYKIKVDNPALPKDALVELYPFGLVENGKSFNAILASFEVDRYRENPHIEIEATKRKKSEMNEHDLSAWEQAQALEAEREAEDTEMTTIAEETPVAGDESIAATEPVEQQGEVS